MNDKQQLAAMCAQYRLIEEQAKGLAERMPQTGALQVIDDEPMCMAKRIEGLEAQVRVMAGLLREARKYVTALGKPDDEVPAVQMTVSRIDALLAGQVPAPASPEGWQLVPEPAVAEGRKPSLTGVNGIDAEFSVKFPSGFDGDPEIRFQSLCIDGDGVGGGQHICAMLAAANWLIDKAEWYRKGSAVINQPCAMFAAAPSPDSTK